MGQWFQITWVGDQVKDVTTRHNTMLKGYRIAVNNSEGAEVRGTKQDGSESKSFSLSQKPETDAPQVGGLLFGHIEDGWKFVKEQTDESAPGPKNPPHQVPELPPSGRQEEAPPIPGADQGGGTSSPVTAAQPSSVVNNVVIPPEIDARQWSIVRQHSQEMAIRYSMLRVAAGEEVDTSWIALKRRIDRFLRDAFNQPQEDDAITPDAPRLPRADRTGHITPENAQALYGAALKKMPGKYLNMALDNLLGRHITNPLDAFFSMTQEQAEQFDADYLQEDAA